MALVCQCSAPARAVGVCDVNRSPAGPAAAWRGNESEPGGHLGAYEVDDAGSRAGDVFEGDLEVAGVPVVGIVDVEVTGGHGLRIEAPEQSDLFAGLIRWRERPKIPKMGIVEGEDEIHALEIRAGELRCLVPGKVEPVIGDVLFSTVVRPTADEIGRAHV